MINKNIRYTLGIAAGKGGVGKSTVTVNLALGLQKLGYAVGILDADIYGPSLNRLLPLETPPAQDGESIVPAVSKGIKLISLSHFREDGEALAVRAPIANRVILQFLQDVKWGELDCLLIDFPPGTGDVQLTLLQEAKIHAALLVTTPQEVALLDVRRAATMFDQMKTPLLGVVENMSYFVDPAGARHYPLGQGGGKRLAQERGLPLLGEIPMDGALAACSDAGVSIYQTYPETAIARSLEQLVTTVRDQLYALEDQSVVIRSLFQKNGTSFTIEWSDGKVSDYTLADIQKLCPCVRCQEKPTQIESEVQILNMTHVGQYALQFEFSSGCSKGVYPIDLLRRFVT